jgi:hypothetical protein
MNFLKTDEAKEIIWLDYCGYHLCARQVDMTKCQAYFVSKGRMDLHNEMNKVEK